MGVRNIVIDPVTLLPTEAGLVWLKRAGVRPEDILLFDRGGKAVSLSPNRY